MKPFIAFIFMCSVCYGKTYSSDGTPLDIIAKQDLCKNGDTITIPAGNFTWGIGSLYIVKGITLKGAGSNMTVITLTGAACVTFVKTAKTNITVQALSFNGPAAVAPITVEGSDGSGSVIFSDVTFSPKISPMINYKSGSGSILIGSS